MCVTGASISRAGAEDRGWDMASTRRSHGLTRALSRVLPYQRRHKLNVGCPVELETKVITKYEGL